MDPTSPTPSPSPAPEPQITANANPTAAIEQALTSQLSFDGDGNLLGMKADAPQRPRNESGQFLASTEPAQAAAPSPAPETPAAPAVPEEPLIPFLDFGPVKASEIPTLHQQHLELERNRAARETEAIRAQATQHETAARELQATIQRQQQEMDAILQWARVDPNGLAAYVANATPQSAQDIQPFQAASPLQAAQQPNAPKYMTEEQVVAKWQEFQANQQRQSEAERSQQELAAELNSITMKELPKELFGDAHDDVIAALQYRIANAPKGTFSPDMPRDWVKRKIQTMILDVKNRFMKLRGGLASQQAALTQTISPQPVSGMTPMPRVESPRMLDMSTDDKAKHFEDIILRSAGLK